VKGNWTTELHRYWKRSHYVPDAYIVVVKDGDKLEPFKFRWEGSARGIARIDREIGEELGIPASLCIGSRVRLGPLSLRVVMTGLHNYIVEQMALSIPLGIFVYRARAFLRSLIVDKSRHKDGRMKKLHG